MKKVHEEEFQTPVGEYSQYTCIFSEIKKLEFLKEEKKKQRKNYRYL